MKTGSLVSRGLALVSLTLALAGSDAFALTNANPLHPTASAIASSAAAKRTPTNEDIRDIRGPKHIPSPWLWPVWLASGAALTAALYAVWRRNRRRSLAVALLPYEIALARLEEARVLMQPESAREFSIAVSEIVRRFIEERFAVSAARKTTEEFLHGLLEPSDALLASHRELLADFLQHCDLAKFARWILSPDEMESMFRSAHAFVLECGESSPPENEGSTADQHPVHATH
jgi:hypothetical protein